MTNKIRPEDVQDDDERMRKVVAECWNTGKPVQHVYTDDDILLGDTTPPPGCDWFERMRQQAADGIESDRRRLRKMRILAMLAAVAGMAPFLWWLFQ